MAQENLFDVIESGVQNSSKSSLSSTSDQCALAEILPQFSQIEGMPVASPEAILNLSLAPFFTAAPNPFIPDEVTSSPLNGEETYGVTAFATDIMAGKNDPLYFLHYYSTKVPPNAIVPYILHYTKPGDVVFDGFCGTGMTGVAAQLCAEISRSNGEGDVGARRAILSDLSPAATFIAAGTNAIGLLVEYLNEVEQAIQAVESQHEQLLHTSDVGWPRGTSDLKKRVNSKDSHSGRLGHIEYVVWSDVFFCSACGQRIVYWDLVFRGPGKTVPKTAPCQHCGSLESIATLQRVWNSRFDPDIGETIRQAEQVPVLINYSIGSKRFEKIPDERDLALLANLDREPTYPAPPIWTMPDGFNTEQPRRSHGYSHVHHFFTKRNLSLLTAFWQRVHELDTSEARFLGLFVLTGAIQRVCRLNRYMPNHDRHVGPLSGTLYVAPLTAEIPVTNYLRHRIKDLRRCKHGPKGFDVLVGTQSATDLRNIPNSSIDYIFTDPPFGGNLNYSELNTLIEAWLGVRTDSGPEAIVNDVQQKGLIEYQDLMRQAFREFNRVLKPGRWTTVEFHNSRNAVWVAIQQALAEAGFIIADVRILDKKKGTTKQLSYGSTVKQDLVISAYKPNGGLEDRFQLTSGTEEGVWDFVRTHLKQLPVFVTKDDQAEVIAERQNFLLFDRMVAFHVQHGVTVPLSAAEFYAGLEQRFPAREGMYFLPDQAAEYDKKRLTVKDVLQLEIFVKDEESAIEWLKQQLTKKPQTFQDLHPQFLKELGGWQKYEKALELSVLLKDNFLPYDGRSEVPSQIHGYLSSNFKDLRNLPKTDHTLKAKAKDRWYVPDPNKAADLVRLRERTLMREFEEYRESRQKRLRVFRLEAVRAGFKKAWQERDYDTIITVADKISEQVLQEDSRLLMWYDQAKTRKGADE